MKWDYSDAWKTGFESYPVSYTPHLPTYTQLSQTFWKFFRISGKSLHFLFLSSVLMHHFPKILDHYQIP